MKKECPECGGLERKCSKCRVNGVDYVSAIIIHEEVKPDVPLFKNKLELFKRLVPPPSFLDLCKTR